MSNCEFDVFDSETNGRNGNVSSYWCAKNRDGAWWNYSNGTGRESAIINDVWINPEGSARSLYFQVGYSHHPHPHLSLQG
jgi:hypothetical protein